MHTRERHQEILRRVRENGSIRVTELAAELGVSPVTVRKDVELLAERGLVARVHGGAMLPEAWAETAPAAAPIATTATSGPRRSLGIIVPSADYYYPDVIKGASEAAADAGANLTLRVSIYSPGGEMAHARQLIDDGIEGLLLAPSPAPAQQSDWYEHLEVPVVLVERRPEQEAPAIEYVVTDHAYGARLAVHHLAEQGRRGIALLMRGGSPTAPWILEGYLAGLRAEGLERPGGEDFVDLGNAGADAHEYQRPMAEMVDAVADGLIDAVLVHPDNDALALLQHLRDRGLNVPAQVAVVSYDDELASLADIPVSAIAPSKHEVGRTAVELLLQRLTFPTRPRRRVLILPELHVRASSMP